ncbi:ADM5-like [Choloepus didactylus]|uniref:ADM5-like n=1 Tax=Choloepus didactylus TaxID=27675 RepID=UPI00189D03AB|nr:ADM5-like [Choloepus didactylus]
MTSHFPLLLPLLLLPLAACTLRAPDSAGRRLCSLGTCQVHRLPEIMYWLHSASTKEPSGKAGREPHDPHGYGRRRRREATVLLHPQEPGPRPGGWRSAQPAG